jgi:hypothetical protein
MHGPGFEHPSCNPPVQTSPHLTVGTPDANGMAANWKAWLNVKTIQGIPSTTEDEANVRFHSKFFDVFRTGSMIRYNRELRMEVRMRVTDKWNSPHPGGAGPGTGEFTLAWTVPCFRRPGTTAGGECGIAFKIDSILPGMAREGARAIWELDQIRAYDGGADDDGDTTADNQLLAVQGLFVP